MARLADPLSAATLALLVAAATAGSCGYSLGYGSFGPSGFRTIAVHTAINQTFRQQLEVPLTRALYQELTQQTGWVPADSARADGILTVTIERIDGRSLVRDATPVREGSLDFQARARLTDRSSGRTLVEQVVLDRGEFRIPVGETTESAAAEAVSDLARKIVLALEGDF